MPSSSGLFLSFYLSVSLFGVFLVFVLALNPPMVYESFPWRKPVVGLSFSMICVLGIFAALFPQQCATSIHFGSSEKNFKSRWIPATSKGHHPYCKKFYSHVIKIRDRILCASCTGLLVGALLALTGTILYFFLGLSTNESLLSMSMGTVGIIMGFFQLKFGGFVRSILNVCFVVGSFLILAGIDRLVQSIIIDLFVTLLIIFWLFTRIQLSHWDHERTCNRCESLNKICELEKRQG